MAEALKQEALEELQNYNDLYPATTKQRRGERSTYDFVRSHTKPRTANAQVSILAAGPEVPEVLEQEAIVELRDFGAFGKCDNLIKWQRMPKDSHAYLRKQNEFEAEELEVWLPNSSNTTKLRCRELSQKWLAFWEAKTQEDWDMRYKDYLSTVLNDIKDVELYDASLSRREKSDAYDKAKAEWELANEAREEGKMSGSEENATAENRFVFNNPLDATWTAIFQKLEAETAAQQMWQDQGRISDEPSTELHHHLQHLLDRYQQQ